ncbi:MAG TPA: hypothetical protein PK272_08510, partial [Methanoregulaceae archaeon]|nr:hypothetical protein [Methanoregulaceae archaeon]
HDRASPVFPTIDGTRIDRITLSLLSGLQKKHHSAGEKPMVAEKKPVLLFTTYKFRSGTNLSVRRGIRWASRLDTGDTIMVQPREGGEQQKALVTGLKVKRFRDIREQELSVEHDPQCHTWNGLFSTMKKLFDDFDETEIVTMIFFTVEGD